MRCSQPQRKEFGLKGEALKQDSQKEAAKARALTSARVCSGGDLGLFACMNQTEAWERGTSVPLVRQTPSQHQPSSLLGLSFPNCTMKRQYWKNSLVDAEGGHCLALSW